MEINLDLKNKTIEDETLRWVEIYKITNKINQKVYIGQAVSHIRKNNKLVPHGTSGRFIKHLQEALGNNNTKYSCRNLNNAIKKYGENNFTLQLLYNCNLDHANKLESEEIIKHNSLVPYGYNLVTNCKSFCPSMEFRQNLSTGLISSLLDKRVKRILKYRVNITDTYEMYVTPKNRNNIQCGWRIRLKDIVLTDTKIPTNKEFEFTSPLISLEENRIRAIEFLKNIKELIISNTTKMRETTLEPPLPLTCGNACEEHD
jgi:hypothetical protein